MRLIKLHGSSVGSDETKMENGQKTKKIAIENRVEDSHKMKKKKTYLEVVTQKE